ncbi:alpha/beta fold hydrolase [Crocosphaera sp. UHCC 0190]|uniref:alpha/beta fold hydrolase n=1 Tax=Crocosphaera sp. UHCC 0190 TaxID=3110246 RepID=UPI002B21814D|nr:alpha/beta fold hydrolase [Crocosphaera sp. UHCC 0190]MEA5509808.1 alpha/beta fold hydrolase [Crocosphaera sp. UHCC 0190]
MVQFSSINSLSLTDEKTWMWRGFPIAYQSYGETGPAVVLVHGFGASWRHWRKNIPFLGQNCRCYALDLIGFGGSAKPSPKQDIDYTFETWGQQVADFCQEVAGSPAFLVGNSIGGVVVMQAAVSYPQWVLGVAVLNCSLRLLHERKQATLSWYRRVGAAFAQRILANQGIGSLFFQQIAKPRTVRRILLQAYHRSEAVTDELIDILLKPAQDEGAVAVFLAFIAYSQGPLPEDLLPILPCPTIFLWGTEDPWENIELAREWANYPNVEQFIPLEGVGHCPQDEAPELVNPILQEWILRHGS